MNKFHQNIAQQLLYKKIYELLRTVMLTTTNTWPFACYALLISEGRNEHYTEPHICIGGVGGGLRHTYINIWKFIRPTSCQWRLITLSWQGVGDGKYLWDAWHISHGPSATGQYMLVNVLWQILQLIFPHRADIGSDPLRAERRRREARHEKFTLENQRSN